MADWLDSLDWDVVHEDLFAREGDALVCYVKTSLEMYGSLGSAMSQRLGVRFDRAARQACLEAKQRDRLRLGEAVTVTFGDDWELPGFGRVILAALWAHESTYTRKLVHGVLSAVFGEARRLAVRSLVCPIPALDSAREGDHGIFDLALLDVLEQNDRLAKAPVLERLTFVSLRPDDVARLRAFLEARL